METPVIEEFEPILVPMRELEGKLGEIFFDADVPRSMIHYNLAVGIRNRSAT